MQKEIVAILFADRLFNKLSMLTNHYSHAMLPYGGKYRIIDFSLSNCRHSQIDTIGLITRHPSWKLINYIGTGEPWDLDRLGGGISILPPSHLTNPDFPSDHMAYTLYQNIEFIDHFSPNHVMVLSGNEVYKMDYSKMLHVHQKENADVTMAVVKVPWNAASHYTTVSSDDKGIVNQFDTKIKLPENNVVSMGIYIFRWQTLKKYLLHHHGTLYQGYGLEEEILVPMLMQGKKIVSYPFHGYWRDITTVQSYWKSNMDILTEENILGLFDRTWSISTGKKHFPPHYIAPDAVINHSFIGAGCTVYGKVIHSILFPGVTVEKGAVVENVIIMPNSTIEADSYLYNCIICENTTIHRRSIIGAMKYDVSTLHNHLYYSTISIVDTKTDFPAIINNNKNNRPTKKQHSAFAI